MSRDKQIEELGNEIFNRCSAGLFEDEANAIADFVINKQGYRKASEVALETLSAVIDKVNELMQGSSFKQYALYLKVLSEIQKIYENIKENNK